MGVYLILYLFKQDCRIAKFVEVTDKFGYQNIIERLLTVLMCAVCPLTLTDVDECCHGLQPDHWVCCPHYQPA